MNCRSSRKKYSEWVIPEEQKMKLDLSEEGIEGMGSRPIRCPRCHQIQFEAFDDNREGHLRVICDRCKLPFVISLRYFHTRNNSRNPWNTHYLNRR